MMFTIDVLVYTAIKILPRNQKVRRVMLAPLRLSLYVLPLIKCSSSTANCFDKSRVGLAITSPVDVTGEAVPVSRGVGIVCV